MVPTERFGNWVWVWARVLMPLALQRKTAMYGPQMVGPSWDRNLGSICVGLWILKHLLL